MQHTNGSREMNLDLACGGFDMLIEVGIYPAGGVDELVGVNSVDAKDIEASAVVAGTLNSLSPILMKRGETQCSHGGAMDLSHPIWEVGQESLSDQGG